MSVSYLTEILVFLTIVSVSTAVALLLWICRWRLRCSRRNSPNPAVIPGILRSPREGGPVDLQAGYGSRSLCLVNIDALTRSQEELAKKMRDRMDRVKALRGGYLPIIPGRQHGDFGDCESSSSSYPTWSSLSLSGISNEHSWGSNKAMNNVSISSCNGNGDSFIDLEAGRSKLFNPVSSDSDDILKTRNYITWVESEEKTIRSNEIKKRDGKVEGETESFTDLDNLETTGNVINHPEELQEVENVGGVGGGDRDPTEEVNDFGEGDRDPAEELNDDDNSKDN